MPLTVGGGVRTIDDIRKLLLAGADKVSINTAAVARPDFVREAAEKFGNQCIVVAIDAKKVSAAGRAGPLGDLHPWRPQADRHRRGRIRRAKWSTLGAGEILLTSMDRDGTKAGFDIALTRADRRRRAGAGDRLRRRRHARPSGRGHPRRPCHARCSPPRSSISAHSRSREAKAHMAKAGLPMRLDQRDKDRRMSEFTLADLEKRVAARAPGRAPATPRRAKLLAQGRRPAAPRSSARRRSRR